MSISFTISEKKYICSGVNISISTNFATHMESNDFLKYYSLFSEMESLILSFPFYSIDYSKSSNFPQKSNLNISHSNQPLRCMMM